MLKMSYIALAAALVGAPALAGTQTSQAAAPAATAAPATAGVQLGADGKIVLTEGTVVVDTQGGTVGTLTKVDKGPDGQPTNVTLKTTKSEVLVPASSLARTDKNAVIAMTAAQVDAAAAAAANQNAGGAAAQTESSTAGTESPASAGGNVTSPSM